MAKLISGVYGEALYETAVSSNCSDDMMQEITVIKKVLDDNPEFTKLMLHPSVSKEEKKKIVLTHNEGSTNSVYNINDTLVIDFLNDKTIKL